MAFGVVIGGNAWLMQPTPPRDDAEAGYAEDRRLADATADPVEERAEAQRDVRRRPRGLEPAPRARIAGWPWALALIVALGFFAWLIYAVWFT
ncbi:MAG TPA: hypothetical protein VFL66_08335 [Gaiellaceae bacterium]|nr:hypothetical protein [Gaiellaceae bacterium]